MADRYEERALAADHEVIWLEPVCATDERHWCQDDQSPCEDCGLPWRKYVRADLVDRWWPIDDPEHPAPRDGTIVQWWLTWADDYLGDHGADDISHWLSSQIPIAIGRYGTWPSFAKATHYRPLPAPPLSGRKG